MEVACHFAEAAASECDVQRAQLLLLSPSSSPAAPAPSCSSSSSELLALLLGARLLVLRLRVLFV